MAGKKMVIELRGYCSDYEGSYGSFTVKIPLEVWSDGSCVETDVGKPEIEWIQKDRYAPNVSFDETTPV